VLASALELVRKLRQVATALVPALARLGPPLVQPWVLQWALLSKFQSELQSLALQSLALQSLELQSALQSALQSVALQSLALQSLALLSLALTLDLQLERRSVPLWAQA